MLVRWISKINLSKTLFVALIFTFISTVVHQVEAILTFVTGIGLTFVYYYIRDYLPSDIRDRILLFADLLVGLQF